MNEEYPDPSLGPRAKVDRAKEHLAEFDREIDAYTASHPYEYEIRDEADGMRHIILKSHKPIPVRLCTVVGDVVHNARSSLDLLVTLAATREAGPVKGLSFPIFRHRADFEAKALVNFGKSCPKLVRFIRRIAPYERGGDAGHHANTLVLLNRLNGRDKHRLIIPVGTWPARAVVAPEPGFGESFMLVPEDATVLRDGEIVMSMSRFDQRFAGKKFNTHLTTQIRLSGVEGLPPIGASSMLHHIVKVVDRIIRTGERHLL